MFRRRDVFAVVAIVSVLSGLVVAGPAQAAATGEWVGTVGVTLTRTAVHPNFEGHGPNLTYEVTDQTVNSVTFSAGSHLEFGVLLECTEDSSTVMTSHEGGSILVGLADPVTLLVQAQLDGYETLTTQVFSGPPESCSNAIVETPNTFQVTVRNTNVTLIDVDQEAASGSVVLLDSSNEGDSRFEKIDYAVHRDCTGFDADADGLADCDELDVGTDPSDADSDGDGFNDGDEIDAGTDPLDDESFPGSEPECDGIVASEVAGTPPTYRVSSPLATFENDDAVCSAVWVPTINDGFVPQGLALVGDGTALVSGYNTFPKKEQCRIVGVDLTTGAQTGRVDLVLSDTRTTDCHGGGIQFDSLGRLWMSDTHRLFQLDYATLFTSPNPSRVITLLGLRGSFLAGGNGGNLWIGDYEAHKLYEFSSSLLDAATVLTPALATVSIDIASKPNGADFHEPNLWVSSSSSTCGLLTVGLQTVTRYRFGPGSEEIQFDADGSLWGVFEAGSVEYPNSPLFPVVARFDPSRLTPTFAGKAGC